MTIIERCIQYFTSYEFILTYIIISTSVFNIIHNYKQCKSIPLNIVLLVAYLLFSSKSTEFKKLFLVVYVFFSVSTYFGEEMVIEKTNKQAIQYLNCPKKRKAAPWLFTAYLTMLLNILVIIEIYWNIVLKRNLPF